MKKHIFSHRLLAFIISVCMIILPTSCTQQKKPIPQASTQKQEEKKPPKELDELSEAIQKIEKTLFDMYERNKKPLFIQHEEIKKEQSQNKEEKQSDDSESSNEASNSDSSREQQSQNQQTLTTAQDKLFELQYETQKMKIEIEKFTMQTLEQLKKDTFALHSLWNAYETKAVAQLVAQSSINDFEASLNNLTKSIQSDNILQSLFDVTQLYKYLPDFYMVYTSDSPAELGKIRFAAKKINLLGEKGDFAEAKTTLEYLSSIWMLTRSKLSKDSMDMLKQFEFAAADLSNELEKKNPNIIKAKVEALIKVTDKIEKAESKKDES